MASVFLAAVHQQRDRGMNLSLPALQSDGFWVFGVVLISATKHSADRWVRVGSRSHHDILRWRDRSRRPASSRVPSSLTITDGLEMATDCLILLGRFPHDRILHIYMESLLLLTALVNWNILRSIVLYRTVRRQQNRNHGSRKARRADYVKGLRHDHGHWY
jgi:hypothetical protein